MDDFNGWLGQQIREAQQIALDAIWEEPKRVKTVDFYCNGEVASKYHPDIHYVFSYLKQKITCQSCGTVYEYWGDQTELD